MKGPEAMNRYLCLAALAVGAFMAASGDEAAAPGPNELENPQIVYRGTLIDGATGGKAVFGKTTKHAVFSVYDSDESGAKALWTSKPIEVQINAADGSFETAFGDESLYWQVVTGRVNYIGMKLCKSTNPLVTYPEITPRRELRPLAAVNRALIAEGAAADISIGTLTAKGLTANVLAVETLEASTAVEVTGQKGKSTLGVGRFTVAEDERTRVVGREVRMFEKPTAVAQVNNPVRGQALCTAPGNGMVLVHTMTKDNRKTLRIPGVVQIVRAGEIVRAPCTEHGSVHVEFYPFAKKERGK